MSKVYVVQEPMMIRNSRPAMRFDLSPALNYGELVYLLDWSDTRDLPGNEDKLVATLRHRLSGFKNGDYILLSGNWTAMALTVAIALEMNNGCARLLQWDREARSYYVVNIDLYSNNGSRAVV